MHAQTYVTDTQTIQTKMKSMIMMVTVLLVAASDSVANGQITINQRVADIASRDQNARNCATGVLVSQWHKSMFYLL